MGSLGSLSSDFSDLLDLADFRYDVPHCSRSYINMIGILKISIQYDKLSTPHCVAGHRNYIYV